MKFSPSSAVLIALIELNYLLIGFSDASVHTSQLLNQNQNMKDDKHGIKMGQIFPGCDDGENDLEMDWDGSPLNYTCYHPTSTFEVDPEIKPITECEYVPPGYMPQHFCMKDRIAYNHSLPTHADHRPLWAIFGEYLFLPPQRWLHNIEHGSIVMLYHPCADPYMVNTLRKLVVNCIRKHVITADSTRLTRERPLALVAWGCRMLMNDVNTHQKYALHGPEGTYSKEGQYSKNLIRKAQIPLGSTYEDSNLCPFVF